MSDINSPTCTAEEATVLSMIKHWPGVPAIVTFDPDEGWSVSTDPADIRPDDRSAGCA